MHHVTDRDGSILEVSDVDRCSACGGRFERYLHTRSWTNCRCAGGHGHRIFICLRGTCRAQTFDPLHDGSAFQAPLEGHRAGSRCEPPETGVKMMLSH